MQTSWYLWNGVGAIEDLNDCTSDEEAEKAMNSPGRRGDWTCWRRCGDTAFVIAVRTVRKGLQLIEVNESKGMDHPEHTEARFKESNEALISFIRTLPISLEQRKKLLSLSCDVICNAMKDTLAATVNEFRKAVK